MGDIADGFPKAYSIERSPISVLDINAGGTFPLDESRMGLASWSDFDWKWRFSVLSPIRPECIDRMSLSR
jgi:hypothetical protein